MAQDLSHDEAVLALLLEPAGQGPAQVVGADLGDLGSGASGGEVPPHVQPLADDGAAALALFAESGSQDRVKRDDPVRAVGFGAVDADGLVGPVQVIPGQVVHFTLASAGVDRHQYPHLPVGRQLGQQTLRLVQGQKPTAWPIRGFELRDQRARIAEEQAAALGQL